MTDQIQEGNPNQERCQYWQAHIEAWTRSNGLSQVEYCRQNGLRPNRFTYWKRKFLIITDLGDPLVYLPMKLKSRGFEANSHGIEIH